MFGLIDGLKASALADLLHEVDRLAPDTLKPGTVWQGAA